jgi:A/G-specific adenine glycosylase
MPYFISFMEEFPTIEALASANEEVVLKKWQGLGYYSRARNLQFSAKYVMNELNGIMPNSYSGLLKLKGVGPYIAAEVASVCYNEVVAAVDGNVQRVIARVYGIEDAVNSTIGGKLVQQIATEQIDAVRPGDFNQALMDFGSGVCTPKKPHCEECIFNQYCWAFKNDKIDVLPRKDKKIKVRDRYFNYLVIRKDDAIYLQKRPEGDVWQGLYQPPLVETEQEQSSSFLNNPEKDYLLYAAKRVLSHQRIWLKFWMFSELPTQLDARDFDWIRYDELTDFPVPKSIEQLFLSLEFTSLFNSVE